MPFKQRLININACKGAIDWVENRTLQQAWNDCHRGDWMLWLLEKMKGKEGWLDEKEIMLLSCWCARRTLKYIPEGEDRPLKAIEAKEKWTRGEITREEMYIAMDAASVAVRDVTRTTASAAVSGTITSYAASYAASATAKTAAWVIASTAVNAANAASNAATNTVAWFAANAVTNAALAAVCIAANDAKWTTVSNKESSIQADYIRTQFTPPV